MLMIGFIGIIFTSKDSIKSWLSYIVRSPEWNMTLGCEPLYITGPS